MRLDFDDDVDEVTLELGGESARFVREDGLWRLDAS
jgi:hypothetical protein